MIKRILYTVAIFFGAGNVSGQELTYIDSTLAVFGLNRSDIQIDPLEVALYANADMQLPFFKLMHRSPLKLPSYAMADMNQLEKDANNPAALFRFCTQKLTHRIDRAETVDHLKQYLVFPDSITKPSIMSSKNILTDGKYKSLRDAIDLIFAIADDDNSDFKRSLRRVNKDKYRKRLFRHFTGRGKHDIYFVEEIYSKIDMARMLVGAHDFIDAAGRLADSIGGFTFPPKKTEIKTNRGLIVIGTTGDDTYEYYDPPLLIVDGGGNDEYKFGGYPDNYPVSIIVDLAGNDKYLSKDSSMPGIGGAVLGLSIVIDKDGDDIYEATDIAQGSAIFGVSILVDEKGADVYNGKKYVQGAAAYGVGIHNDLNGNDSLTCTAMSQGFGNTMGVGLLLNGDGDDKYLVIGEGYFEVENAGGVIGFGWAQGAGVGNWAEESDGHNHAGGIGLLYDLGGNDSYESTDLSQGFGFWYGLGMLIDRSGDDSYLSLSHAQGTGLRVGVGFLEDMDGDDIYTIALMTGAGTGIDLSVGFLYDKNGDDKYESSQIALGVSRNNSIGIFCDEMGNDIYTMSNERSTIRMPSHSTFGDIYPYSPSSRELIPSFAIFIDGSGDDDYIGDMSNNLLRRNRVTDYSGRDYSLWYGIAADWGDSMTIDTIIVQDSLSGE